MAIIFLGVLFGMRVLAAVADRLAGWVYEPGLLSCLFCNVLLSDAMGDCGKAKCTIMYGEEGVVCVCYGMYNNFMYAYRT